MHTLNDLLPGDSARIVSFRGPEHFRQRFMDLGLIEGARVEMIRSAPLGDPIQVKVMGAVLALRRREADMIHVGEETRGGTGRHRHRFGRQPEQRKIKPV
jgi:ferrous iron transport protein A